MMKIEEVEELGIVLRRKWKRNFEKLIPGCGNNIGKEIYDDECLTRNATADRQGIQQEYRSV